MEIRFDRLEKLAEYLEETDLKDKWNFSHFISANSCGTSGCALGNWYLHDKEFGAAVNDSARKLGFDLSHLNFYGPFENASRKYFGITQRMFNHLFLPYGHGGMQILDTFGGQVLDPCATPEVIARQIRAFITKLRGPEVQIHEATEVITLRDEVTV